MRTVVLCATLAACILPPNAGAQSLPLTEAEALARLSPASPRVRAISAGIDVARADVLAAGRWPNPRLTFDREAVAGVTENMVMVSQALPITGRRGFEVQAASALVDASSSRADEALRRARADLRLAFGQLVSAQVREQELTASRDRLRALAEILAKREAAGDAAGFDRLRAEREVVDVDTDRAAAATDRARAQAILAGFFRRSGRSAAALSLLTRLECRHPCRPVDALVERAESTRGELLALRKEGDAARLSRRAADRRRVPEPEVVAGTKSSTAGRWGHRAVSSRYTPLCRCSTATVPNGRWPKHARNRPRRERTRFASRFARRLPRFASPSWNDARPPTVTGPPPVNGIGEIERIAQVSYDAGERGILELLDAYRTGASARVRQAALDAAVRQAEIELEFVSGWEIPR